MIVVAIILFEKRTPINLHKSSFNDTIYTYVNNKAI
jgi:hypothetical protein